MARKQGTEMSSVPTVTTKDLMSPTIPLKSVYDDGRVLIYHDDALRVVQQTDRGTINCIITDCAYWTLNKHRSIGTTARLGGHRDADKRKGWFETITPEDLWEFTCEFSLLLPENSHCWLFADNEVQAVIQAIVNEGNTKFNYVKSFPVIKMRNDGGGLKPGMGYHGRATHEYLVLCEKGRRRFNQESWPDVFMQPWTGALESKSFTPDSKPYPTAKPFNLYRWLMQISTNEGETILDPFAGSGPVITAALAENRKSNLC
jgi:site-specific DNA-methyltransferase (adenine-specific)